MDQLRSQLASLVRRTNAAHVLGAALVFAVACSDQKAGEQASSPPSVGEGGSPYSLDSALKLFRVGLDSLTDLQDAYPSIDSTVRRFATMIERRDTATMRAMVMTRREYAWLYYPTSPYTRDPTKQEPGLAWFLHLQNSQKGATRLLDRFGGGPLRIVRNDCKGPTRAEGQNRMWDDCVQRVVERGDTVVIRLFGGIYERNGRFKIFSYSNDL